MRMDRKHVLQQALALKTPLVQVTGGEPLLQPGCLALLSELCDAQRTVLLETSGERDISGVDARVHRIVDLKAPGSGEAHRNRWANLELLSKKDEIKFVLSDRTDYEWARSIIADYSLGQKVGCVLLSCVFGQLNPRLLVEWVLEDDLDVRVQLQLHKYIWPAQQRGV